MAQGLTKKELIAKNAIINYIKKEGISPSFRNLMDILNIKSTSGIYDLMERLESKGHIKKRNKYFVRNIVINDICPACGRDKHEDS